MEEKKQNVIEKYLNTKSKKIAAGCVAWCFTDWRSLLCY